MPVAKNKRKNGKTAGQLKHERMLAANAKRKLNSAPVVAAYALNAVSHVLEHIRKLARTYVDVTTKIPNYAETNPEVKSGLSQGIELMKKVIAKRDDLSQRVADMHKTKAHEDNYFPLMIEIEQLNEVMSQEMVPCFFPIMDTLEKLAETTNIDKTQLAAAREACMKQAKPKFETKL